ncbi:MAG: deoxyribose-phosphate aldolase [Bacteroidales bacterium]|nr:deoxyribose-phosphate aldolase [Bacteroidales bacterium]
MNFNKDEITQAVIEIARIAEKEYNIETLKKIFNCIDLTSLNTDDNNTVISQMVEKVSNFSNKFPEINNVAAICVYPNFVKIVKEKLTDKNVKIAAVAGGFPSSQTFLSIKLAETNLAIEKGADEVDIVLSVGKFLNKEYREVTNEIVFLKNVSQNACLKVILETGLLKDEKLIYDASIVSMESGADFIKTSTGKLEPMATYEAVYVMCNAIKDYYEKNKRMVGIKPSGGITAVRQAITYYTIVKTILGEDWLNNSYFRIGTSRLANNLLGEILRLEGKSEIKYF